MLLNNVTLNLNRGERVLILGPSGCGKSSLLLIIAGIIPEVIPGVLYGTVRRETEKIAVVLQNPEAQMIAPTVEEEIAFGLENEGIDPSEIRRKIKSILTRLGITHLQQRSPSQLSGGERQKVSLASALVSDPDILLLDEPTAFLDPDSTYSFFELLKNLDSNISIFIVEHKLEHALDIVDRYYMLDEEGSICADAPVSSFDKREHLPWILAQLSEEQSRPTVSYDSPQTVLKTTKLSHAYNTSDFALDDICLHLTRGETVSVMGANGAGKTTLLKKISALLPNRKGSIFLQGEDIVSLSAEKIYSRILLLPQNPEHYFLRERVKDELHVGTSNDSEHIVHQFKLAGLTEQNPYRLSEGEKRRLNFACAFAEDREILLLDEPVYGLDYFSYEALVSSLRMLKARGVSILLVTHSPELSFLVADRILLLESGQVKCSGTPRQILSAEGSFPRLYLPTWERM